jgi:hypothetical protein
MLRGRRKPGIEESRRKKLNNMKKIFLFLMMLSASQFLFAQKDTDKTITVELITDARLSGSIKDAFNTLNCNPNEVVTQCQIPTFASADFDFNKIYKSQKPGEREIGYSVRYKNPASGIEYSFSVVDAAGVLLNPMLVKVNTDRSRIVYNEINENKALTVNNNNGVFTYTISDVNFGGVHPNVNVAAEWGCGQCVSNCITDAYSNHGWASVWAVVQSIFIPATGVGITLGCIGKCCAHT